MVYVILSSESTSTSVQLKAGVSVMAVPIACASSSVAVKAAAEQDGVSSFSGVSDTVTVVVPTLEFPSVALFKIFLISIYLKVFLSD